MRRFVPDWVPLGDRAIRFARPPVSARALVREIRAWPGVVDVVVALEDVAAYFISTPHVEAAWIAKLADLRELAEQPREHTITALYTVETIGFAPGFAYLAGLDPRLHVPRRATPRPRVPARSLAIAAQYTA